MCACCGELQPASWRYVTVQDKQERVCNGMSKIVYAYTACGLYFKKHGIMKTVTASPPKRPPPKRKPRAVSETTSVFTREESVQSSPPTRTYEPMSEIEHPLLSEGICLPRMGYLRGGALSGDDDGNENFEPEDEMERFFSDVLA